MCKENENADKKTKQEKSDTEYLFAYVNFSRNIFLSVAFIAIIHFLMLKGTIEFSPIICYLLAAVLGTVISFIWTYHSQIKNVWKNRKEYNEFDQEIRKKILKRNPVECRKEMKRVLEEYCARQCKNGISEDEVINALIEQYKGRVNDNEVYNNVMSIAFAMLIGGYAILASVFLQDTGEMKVEGFVLVLALVLIVTAAVFFLVHKINELRPKAGNNGYILAFLENCKDETKANRQSKQEKE